MQPELRRYVDRACAIARDDLTRERTVAGVERALQELVDARPVLPDEYRILPASGYGRNRVHLDEESGCVVIAMVWPPGFVGKAHDHESWCVLGVLEGRVRLTNFTRQDDGSVEDRVVLGQPDTFEASAGVVASVLPPPNDYHILSNASGTEVAITLHTYGADTQPCRLIDLERHTTKLVQLSYTNA